MVPKHKFDRNFIRNYVRVECKFNTLTNVEIWDFDLCKLLVDKANADI